MNLTRFLNQLFKDDGFVLIDANSKESFSFLKYAQEYCLFLSKNKSYNFSEIS